MISRRWFLPALFVASILSLTSCSQGLHATSNPGPLTDSARNGTAPPSSEPETPRQSQECWVYPNIQHGSCDALVMISSLSDSEKDDYQYPSSSNKQYIKPIRVLDLRQISPEHFLTKSFRVIEFMSEVKGRYGIFAEHAIQKAQEIRDRLNKPLRINSAYRSPAYNKKIGGAKLSRHMYGDGLDLGSKQATPNEIKDQCRAHQASYIQVYADGHVHCDWRSHKPDSTFYSAPVQPPTRQTIQILSDEEFLELQYEISGSPSITEVVSTHGLRGNSRRLIAALGYQEDPGELLVEWSVQSPSGEIFEFTGSSLLVDDITSRTSSRGVYQVRVRVGGYVETSTQLQID